MGSKRQDIARLGSRTADTERRKHPETPKVHQSEIAALSATANLGKEIAFWEMPCGGEYQYLYSDGTEYHIVTEIARIRWRGKWVKASEADMEPGVWPQILQAEKHCTYLVSNASKREVVEWFFENHICGFVPEEFYEAFRPRLS